MRFFSHHHRLQLLFGENRNDVFFLPQLSASSVAERQSRTLGLTWPPSRSQRETLWSMNVEALWLQISGWWQPCTVCRTGETTFFCSDRTDWVVSRTISSVVWEKFPSETLLGVESVKVNTFQSCSNVILYFSVLSLQHILTVYVTQDEGFTHQEERVQEEIPSLCLRFITSKAPSFRALSAWFSLKQNYFHGFQYVTFFWGSWAPGWSLKCPRKGWTTG